jgi:excisionase family DNA binding protein
MADEHFLTTEEVLDYLQVNLRTVYRLIKAGKIPAVRVGRQWRFRRRDLDDWLLAYRSQTTRDEALGRPRILVAEDEPAIRALITKTLSAADYDVDEAPDGLSAIERLRAFPYDLLVTDLMMPGMDGLSVIREGRRESPDLPVIIISGHATQASAIEAINLGVSGLLTKPFRVLRVLAVVARALGEPEPTFDD